MLDLFLETRFNMHNKNEKKMVDKKNIPNTFLHCIHTANCFMKMSSPPGLTYYHSYQITNTLIRVRSPKDRFSALNNEL